MTTLLTAGSLQAHPFLHGCTADFVDQLLRVSREVTFAPGSMILQEGDYADRCYLIRSGRVQLTTSDARETPLTIQILGPGDVLGWSWLYPPFKWHFSARALEACQAVELDTASLLERAEKDPAFGYELMKRVSSQLVQRLQATRARLAQVSIQALKGGAKS